MPAGPSAPATAGAGDVTLRPDDLLRDAVRGQLRHLLPACLATMVHQGCEALVPVLIGVVVDQAIGRGSVTRLVVLIAALVVLFAVLTSSMRLGGRAVRRATQGAGHALRVRLAARVLDARGTASDAVVGETLSTATSDTTRVGMVNAAVWTAAGAAAAIAVTAALLLSNSLVLGVVVVVGLIPVVALVSRITRPLVRRSVVEQATAATAAGVATDFLTGLRRNRVVACRRPCLAAHPDPPAVLGHRLEDQAGAADVPGGADGDSQRPRGEPPLRPGAGHPQQQPGDQDGHDDLERERSVETRSDGTAERTTGEHDEDEVGTGHLDRSQGDGRPQPHQPAVVLEHRQPPASRRDGGGTRRPLRHTVGRRGGPSSSHCASVL